MSSLQSFAVRWTHVPIKACKINEHILYEEHNKYSLANCTHERKLSNELIKQKLKFKATMALELITLEGWNVAKHKGEW